MDKHNDLSLIGVVHLPPLPSAPRSKMSFSAVRDHALRDAEALVAGGIGRCIIENFGDAPFRKDRVEPHVAAMMAVIGSAINDRFCGELELGINVLRNDGGAAVAVAASCDARFVRINVLCGSAWTDQGLIEGRAADVLRYRRTLGHPVRIMADICVKHAVPAGETNLGRAALDCLGRGGADGVIVTGVGTGAETAIDDVVSVRRAVPEAEVWVGSGVTPKTVQSFRPYANGAIVGTYLHRDGIIQAPIDEDRVRTIVEASRS